MKIGDLVEYFSKHSAGQQPRALVIDERSPGNSYHHRIRVLWLGKDIPIQAHAVSVKASRISSWVHPRHFVKI
mgnify:CR=1 FL=1